MRSDVTDRQKSLSDIAERTLKPEFLMLLESARWRIGTLPQPTHFEEHSRDIDGAELISIARFNSMSPLLLRYLKQTAQETAEVHSELKADTTARLVWSMQQVQSLTEVLGVFAEHSIRSLCVKGPVLAKALYGDLAQRPFGDIDLIIHPEDFQRSFDVLSGIEFHPVFDLPRSWHQIYFDQQSECPFLKSGRHGIVDLHSALIPPRYSFAADLAGIWDGTEQVSFDGVHVDTLDADMTLAFLALHAGKHDWMRLIWLVDLGLLITHRCDLDWDRVLQLLRDSRGRVLLGVSLILTQSLLGVELPVEVLAQIHRDDRVAGISKQWLARWNRCHVPSTTAPWPWRRLYYHCQSTRSDRWNVIHDGILRPTPREWLALPLPVSLRSAYYGLRPVRLLWRHVTGKGID